MKAKLFFTTLLISLCLLTQAQNTILISIPALENSNGNLMVELVNSQDILIDQKAVPLTSSSCKVTFHNVPNGRYAIRYFHDENENGKIDTGKFGIPKEGYGFSNNARGFMGPPDLEDMLFNVSADVEMTLKTVN